MKYPGEKQRKRQILTNQNHLQHAIADNDRSYGRNLMFWGVFFGLYFCYSVVVSWLAPAGYWINTVFGSDFWFETDPGGAYLASAIQLFESKHQYYFGHPGVTLHLILYTIAKCYYYVSSFWNGDARFYTFAVRNLSTIFFLSKLCLSLLHFISFYLVYRFALKILWNNHASIIATLAYASSFPVLYFLSRIAPEPIMVIFFLLSFLFIWEYNDRVQRGNITMGLLCVSLSAVSAVLGFFTKLQLLGVLPFCILLYLIVNDLSGEGIFQEKLKKSGISVGIYIMSGAFTAFLCNMFVDWNKFFRTSSDFALGIIDTGASSLMRESIFDRGIFIFRACIPRFLDEFIKPIFLGQGDIQGHVFWFTLSECLFFLVTLVGIVLYFHRSKARSYAVWPLVYSALTFFVWMYRLSFHYLFILMPVAAVFFGYAADIFLDRFNFVYLSRFKLTKILVLILIIHFIAITANVTSKIYDARQYNEGPRQVYKAMAMVDYDEHIALITKTVPSITLLYKSVMNSLNIFFPFYFPPEAQFLSVIDKMFVHITLNPPASEKSDAVNTESRENNVLDKIFLHIIVESQVSQNPDALNAVLRKNNVGIVLEEVDDSILGPFTLEEFEKKRLHY